MTVPVKEWFEVATGFDLYFMNARGRAVLWNFPAPTALQHDVDVRDQYSTFTFIVGINPVPQA